LKIKQIVCVFLWAVLVIIFHRINFKLFMFHETNGILRYWLYNMGKIRYWEGIFKNKLKAYSSFNGLSAAVEHHHSLAMTSSTVMNWTPINWFSSVNYNGGGIDKAWMTPWEAWVWNCRGNAKWQSHSCFIWTWERKSEILYKLRKLFKRS